MDELKIGIIGGSGYIGSSIAKHLSRVYKIKILDLQPPKGNLKGNIEFQECDIRKHDELKKRLEDVSVVVHAAIVQIPMINENKRLGYEVNISGTQNVCSVVNDNPLIKGMVLVGSWHVFGEEGLRGIIDEEFGFRPDKVEDRAKLYALSKIAQEIIVRYHDLMSKKIYAIIRLGTVLGEGMPEKTAASVFINRGLNGESITPYRHSMYRPMLYVDINDVCIAFATLVDKIIKDDIQKKNGESTIINVCWPEPVTVLELAGIVRDAIVKHSKGKLSPETKIIDTGQPSLFSEGSEKLFEVKVDAMTRLLGIKCTVSPRDSIERLVKQKMNSGK